MVYHGDLWNEIREMTMDKAETDEKISWKELHDKLEKMEYEFDVKKASSIVLNEDEMKIGIELARMGNENGGNCYDYLEYIDYKAEQEHYIVGVFTEPLGIIGFQGKNLKELLSNIYKLYSSQPADMSYIEAGHILYNLQEELEYELNFEDNITDISAVWCK